MCAFAVGNCSFPPLPHCLTLAWTDRYELREESATKIQRMMRASKGQEFFEVVRNESRKIKRHIRMQAVARGWMTRARLEKARLWRKAMERAEPQITVFKAHWRAGHLRHRRREVRGAHDEGQVVAVLGSSVAPPLPLPQTLRLWQVPVALVRQRVARRREAAVIAAHRLQLIIRAKFAREK